jgi:hypothetical protein
VSTFKYKSLRETLRIEAIFSRPILEWEQTSARFYSMIYDALAAKIPLNVGDFSVQPATILSEVRAKYSIYGGATSVTLHANKIVFDFPNLIPSDFPIVREVVSSIHDVFPKAFPELDYKTMEVQSFEHLELLEDGAVELFLERYKVPGVENAFKSPIVSGPAMKFAVVSQDQKWQCSFAAERSLLSPRALFTALNLSLRDVSPSSPFIEKIEAVLGLERSCFAAVGLERANGSST